MNRAKLLRTLFALARERGVDIDKLRDMARRAGYGTSLRVLDDRQLGMLLNQVRQQGLDSTPEYLPFRVKPAPGRRPLLAKMSRLLYTMQLSWDYADGIAYKMFGCDRVEWLKRDRLHAVVAALNKQHLRRL